MAMVFWVLHVIRVLAKHVSGVFFLAVWIIPPRRANSSSIDLRTSFLLLQFFEDEYCSTN
jgi:hypothetical protein